MKGFIRSFSLIVSLFCAVLLFAPAAGSEPGEEPRAADPVSSDDPRAAKVKDLMRGVQQPAIKRLMAAAKQTPASDKDWDEIRSATALLNENGHILMQAGRSRNEVWSKGKRARKK